MAEENFDQENSSKERLDEGLEEFKGQEGEAPQDEELTTLPEELSNKEESFSFKRESAPKEEEKPLEQNETKEMAWYQDKKFLSLVAGSIIIVCSLIFTLFYLTFNGDNIKADIIATKQQETVKNEALDESYQYNIAKIDTMIKKANALYLKGEIEQALKAYEQIAIYNESLSSYNLGVSQMNENKFEEALQNFKKAINNGENQTVSAINAAVCALRLNDKERFKYYIDLAQVYLPKEGNSKLYDYYLALINFYKGYYPEALQMFQKTSTEPYSDSAKYLSAKIYSKMDLNSKAITYLKEQNSLESSLSLGLLYARIGEYQKAKNALNTALKIERDFNQSLAAITLIDLKIGQYQEMLSRLNNAYKNKEDRYRILDTYKIKVNLNKDLFNIQIAQENFSRNFFKQPKEQFDLLFYYAPYQVFDSKQSSLYIKKANITYFVDDSVDASFYLKTGKALSSTNVRIASIVNLALNQKLKQANKGFQDLIKEYPEHSILHYNLALTYAQLKNYNLAYKHFSSSYHLNPKNYLAGVFAMFCAKISGIDTTKFYNEIQDNISNDKNLTPSSLYRNMFFLANEDYTSILPYLDEVKKDNHPLSLIFEAIAFKNNNLDNQADIKIAQLKSELPNDVLSNILYFNSLNIEQDIKDYAQNAQIYFQNAKLDYKSIFGGAIIAREKYTSLMQIAGLLNLERQKFKDLLNISNTKDEGLIQALAYIDIFSLHFEEAYALYNTLIDNYKVNDSHTLFLASVAAIGSNNPNSAIALLQLAKLKDNNKESKAALGLLYQQVQNYEPALLQYKDLPDNFKSEFFTFEIKR